MNSDTSSDPEPRASESSHTTLSRRDWLTTLSASAVGVTVGTATVSQRARAADAGEQEWAFETGDGVGSSPTVANGTVYVGSGDSNLYAVDAATGDQQWAFETGDSVFSSPTVADGTVYVGSNDENLYAVDAATGEQQWAFETGGNVDSSPTVVDGTVYVGSQDQDDNLYAVDAATGEQQWAFETGGKVESSPTVADGTVYVGSWDDNLYAVDAATGEQEWAFETGDWVRSSPTVADGTVYVGSRGHNLYAVGTDHTKSSSGSRVRLDTLGHHVNSTPVEAVFSVAPATVDNPVQFDASSSSGSITSYKWDFTSDGTVDATGQQVEHTFSTTGTYTVTLTVSSETGTTETTSKEVTVTEPISQLWAFETGDAVFSSPTMADGTVYVGSYDFNLHAVDAATGEQQWAFETGDSVSSSPTVADGTVYIGSQDGNLYAVDAATGEQQWAFQAERDVTSSPTVADGTAYIGSLDNNLYAVDAATGQEQWAFETGDSVSSSPTVADGTVYVGSLDFNLYAVDAATGDQQWAFETGDSVSSSPTVADGTVYVGSDDSNLYAVDAATGEQQWAFETGDWVGSSPTVADGTVYVGSSDWNLYAVDAATGDQQWAFETGSFVFSSPTVADGTVYVGSLDSNLYAVDAATGEQQWAFQAGDWVRSSPTVADGTVYVGSDDTNLYAIETTHSESSHGSRVRLQTLGHHDQSIRGGQFDPRHHGFGFKNWSTGPDSDYPSHDEALPSRDEIRRVIEDSWMEKIEEITGADTSSSINTLGLRSGLTLLWYTMVNQGAATNGHCHGMVYAAQQYYQNPGSLPDGVETASGISKPTGKFSGVGDQIDFYQNSQLLDVETFLTLVAGNSDAAIDYAALLDTLKTRIDRGNTVPLSLTVSDQDGGHSVLAYSYVSVEDTKKEIVKVYDPNEKASNYSESGGGSMAIFDTSGDEVTLERYRGPGGSEYNRMLILSGDKELKTLDTVISGALGALLASKLTGVVTFGTQSPISITVTDPTGSQLDKVTAPFASESPTEFEEVFVQYEAPPGEYAVDVEGEDDGEYTIVATGQTTNGSSISEEVSGTITEGEQQEFSATIPKQDSQTGTIQRTDESESATPTQDETEPEPTEPETSSTGDASGVGGSGFPLWLPAAGGAVGVGSLGYLLNRMRDSDSDDSQ